MMKIRKRIIFIQKTILQKNLYIEPKEEAIKITFEKC